MPLRLDPAAVASGVALLVAQVVGELDRHRPLEDRLGHLLEQTTLTQQLDAVGLGLGDKPISEVLIDEPRFILVTPWPAHPCSVQPGTQNFSHCLSSPNSQSCPVLRSSPYTEDLTRPFKTLEEARTVVGQWCDGFYNQQRRHSAANRVAPTSYEQHHLNTPPTTSALTPEAA